MSEILVSSFSGAFLAFLFVRLGDYLTKLYEKHKSHYNALIILQTELNRLYGVLDDNNFLFPNFIKTIQEKKLYFNKLHEITVSDKHLENLFNIKLINELFELLTDIARLNNDMKNINEMYSEIKQVYIQRLLQKQITEGVEEYTANTRHISENLISLAKFTAKLQEKTLQTLAIVRIKSETDKPLFSVVLGGLLKGLERYPTDKSIEKELIILKQEIEDCRKKSAQEIEEII